MTPIKLSGIWTFLLVYCVHAPLLCGQGAGDARGRFSSDSPSAQTAQIPLHATGKSEFAIPFSVDSQAAQPVEVHLYVSVDRGQSWQLQSRQRPSARHFAFRAPRDGEYWFASRTLDGGRQSQPSGTLQPELRVVVDTVSPQIELNARVGQSGEIIASWQVFDENLVVSSLNLEYQGSNGDPWRPVAVQPPQEGVVRTSYQGQTRWRPRTQSSTLNLRAEVRDRAGNLGVANRRLLMPAQSSNGTNASPARHVPEDPFARRGRPSEGAVQWPSAREGHQRAAPSRATAPKRAPHGSRPVSRSARPSPSPPQTPSATASTSMNPSPDSASIPAAESTDAARSETPPAMADSNPPPQRSAFGQQGQQIVKPAKQLTQSPMEVAEELPTGERPQMTDSRRFQLEYDVAATGSAGVAEVQLWATADAGRTWRLWGTDDDLQSPFDVAVERDGIFGFHVVLVGKNGMSGRRPRTGDPADIWIGVDTTAPTAELTGATYGDGPSAGKLIIQWRAADSFLDPRPVTLYYSEAADGPWSTIVSSLPNNGQFAWSAGPELPPDVYLKLEVRDQAGNRASAQTDQPVCIAELAPKARIRGVHPVQQMDREAFRVPRRR